MLVIVVIFERNSDFIRNGAAFDYVKVIRTNSIERRRNRKCTNYIEPIKCDVTCQRVSFKIYVLTGFVEHYWMQSNVNHNER